MKIKKLKETPSTKLQNIYILFFCRPLRIDQWPYCRRLQRQASIRGDRV